MKVFFSTVFIALALGGCCTGVENKVDSMQKDIVVLRELVDQTTTKVNDLTARVGELSGKIDNLEKRVTVLEGKDKKEKKSPL
jgi:outer membrane murein-binding lipoprotein Lpp